MRGKYDVLALLSLALMLVARAAPAQVAVAVDVPTGGAGCSFGAARLVPLPLMPVALNARSEVLGTDEAHRAARWRADAGVEELPLPAGFERSEPVALNDAGAAVAIAVRGAGGEEQRQPYVVSEGRLIALGGIGARPFRIDSDGRIAGEAVLTANGRSQPVVWRLMVPPPKSSKDKGHRAPVGEGGLMPRALESCCGGTAKLLDGQGGAAGDIYDPAGRYHAVRWQPGRAPEPLQPGDGYSSALAMNEHGTVVFVAFPRVWLSGSHAAELLSLAPHRPSHPHALNDCELLVGDYGPYADAARAFVWNRRQGFLDLNSRIDLPAGWTLKSAIDVNDRGEIIGRAETPGDLERGFLLEPIAH